MKPLSPLLRLEQLQPSCTPSIKLQAQAYGHPAASADIRFNKFDWVDTGFGGCEMACCPSDGSLLMKVSSTNIRRYADPTVDSYTNITIPTAIDAGNSDLVVSSINCMIASPATSTSAEEVLLLGFGTNLVWGSHPEYPVYVLCYSTSADYGVTWAAWKWDKYLPLFGPGRGLTWGESNLIPVDVKAAYKPTGDIGAVVRLTWWGGSSSNRDTFVFIRRTSGTWVTFDFANGGRPPIAVPVEGGYRGAGMCGGGGDSYGQGVPYVTSYDIAWSDDWFVPYVMRNPESTNKGALYLVWGDGTNFPQDKLHHGGDNGENLPNEINIADANIKINDLSDYNKLSIPSIPNMNVFDAMYNPASRGDEKSGWVSTSDLRHALMTRGDTLRNDTSKMLMDYFAGGGVSGSSVINEIQAGNICSVESLPNGDVVLAMHFNNKALFLLKRPDFNVINAVFYKGYAFENNYPLYICANTRFIFAYNNNGQMFRSAYLDWDAPTAGTGAGGTYDIPFSKVIHIAEQRNDGEPSTLEFIVDNSNDAYDSPVSGTVGSRLNVYLGYKIGGVDVQVENNRYFIDSIGYLRVPNRALFSVRCIDGWGLMNKYRFNAPVHWNEYDSIYKYNFLANGNFSNLSTEDPIIGDAYRFFPPWVVVNWGLKGQDPSGVGLVGFSFGAVSVAASGSP